MNVYHLYIKPEKASGIDDYYNHCYEGIVVAENEKAARNLMSEKEKIYKDPYKTACDQIDLSQLKIVLANGPE